MAFHSTPRSTPGPAKKTAGTTATPCVCSQNQITRRINGLPSSEGVVTRCHKNRYVSVDDPFVMTFQPKAKLLTSSGSSAITNRQTTSRS